MLRVLIGLTLLLSPAVPAQESASDAAALRQLVTTYEQAVRSGDVSKTGIRKSLTDGFSAALPSGQIVKNYGELAKAENALRTMVGRGASYDPVNVSLDPTIEVRGDLAVFSGQTENRATAQAGKSRTFTTYWTAVARKEGGQWRLARHQAVIDPANNPWNGEETSSRPRWSWVLGGTLLGGLAGLVVGVALGRLLRLARPSSTPTSPSPPKPRAWQTTPPATPAPPETPPTQPHVPETPPSPEKKRAWEK